MLVIVINYYYCHIIAIVINYVIAKDIKYIIMLRSCKRKYDKKTICSNKLDLEDSACHEINKQYLLCNCTAQETVTEFRLHQAPHESIGECMR